MTPGEVAGRVWQGLATARTPAERDFLRAVGEEYHVDYISVAAPEGFRAWEAELRAAAVRLSRTPLPSTHQQTEGS
jgi:hypothetical protein